MKFFKNFKYYICFVVKSNRTFDFQHEERVEALKEYKRKKEEKFKVLSRKTKRGQPVMGARMEMLLEKIQQST